MPRVAKIKTELKARNKKRISKRQQKGIPRIPPLMHIKHVKKSNLRIIIGLSGVMCEADRKYGSQYHNLTSRPYLDPFLKFCRRICEDVSIYTHEPLKIALKTRDALLVSDTIPLSTQEDMKVWQVCWVDNTYYASHKAALLSGCLTDLHWVEDFNPNNTLIIDFTANYYQDEERKNLIQVLPYDGKDDDFTLEMLALFIKQIAYNKIRNMPELITAFVQDYADNFVHVSKRNEGMLDYVEGYIYNPWKYKHGK